MASKDEAASLNHPRVAKFGSVDGAQKDAGQTDTGGAEKGTGTPEIYPNK